MPANAVAGGPENGLRTKALGTFGPKEKLQIIEINRRYPLKPHDVLIEIAYCGICHSDIHHSLDEWGEAIYPMVPGHEITGFIKETGSQAKKFKIGEKCGVTGLVFSCGVCGRCTNRANNYCDNRIFVFNSKDDVNDGGCITYGGFSTHIVVNENYVLKWPDKLPMDEGAPLLCAGITVYSPLRYLSVGPGTRVGVVGLGGLGHIAVRLAYELGAFVCVFSRGGSAQKRKLAKELGADMFIATGEGDKLESAGQLDVILDTVSADHDVNALVALLKYEGTYVPLGVPPNPLSITLMPFLGYRRSLLGSMISSIEECQDMLDFCARRNIVCMTEKIKADEVNAAYDRTIKGQVCFRFVIDIKGSSWK